MSYDYVTLGEIKRLLADNKKSKQSAIYKVADLCGTWYTERLLPNVIREKDLAATIDLFRAFNSLYLKNTSGIYHDLYDILRHYFYRMAVIDVKRRDKRKGNWQKYINRCINDTYYKLCDILLDEDDLKNDKQQVRSKVLITEDGVVTDIKLEIVK